MPLAQILSSTKDPEMKETKFGRSPNGSFASYQLQFTESNFKVFCHLGPSQLCQNKRDPPSSEYPKFPLRPTESYKLPGQLGKQEAKLLSHLIVDSEKLNKIEHNTCNQSLSDEWKRERRYRFTASNFKKVCIRQRNHEALVKSFLNPVQVNSKYIEHGKKLEPIALRQYQKYMYSIGRPVLLYKSGLVVGMDTPFLGASPDGKVIDLKCIDQFGLVEIKCPQTKFHVTPLEACSDAGFCCEAVDGKLKLKRNHEYFYQVQGQLGVTKASWCDFVIYTNEGMSIERISFDRGFWENVRGKLSNYYFSRFIKTAAQEFCKPRND